MRSISTACDESSDSKFAELRDLLTWHPWVGRNYGKLPPGKRLLIVGESHYIGEKDPAKISDSIQKHHGDWSVTREAVINGFIKKAWTNPTYSGVDQLLLPGKSLDRHAFWGDVCYYNFIQRIMSSPGERPSKDDNSKGWKAFLKVVEILQPDHCLFIGVSASNFFNIAMGLRPVLFTKAARGEKIKSTWSRHSSVTVNGQTSEIHFIQHTSGRGFDSSIWRGYLQRQAPDIIRILSNPDYILPEAANS